MASVEKSGNTMKGPGEGANGADRQHNLAAVHSPLL